MMRLDVPPLSAIRARWLFPVSGPPIAGGVVTFQGSRIVAVGEAVSGCQPRDLGDGMKAFSKVVTEITSSK